MLAILVLSEKLMEIRCYVYTLRLRKKIFVSEKSFKKHLSRCPRNRAQDCILCGCDSLNTIFVTERCRENG